jgi:hypothetical protein
MAAGPPLPCDVEACACGTDSRARRVPATVESFQQLKPRAARLLPPSLFGKCVGRLDARPPALLATRPCPRPGSRRGCRSPPTTRTGTTTSTSSIPLGVTRSSCGAAPSWSRLRSGHHRQSCPLPIIQANYRRAERARMCTGATPMRSSPRPGASQQRPPASCRQRRSPTIHSIHRRTRGHPRIQLRSRA